MIVLVPNVSSQQSIPVTFTPLATCGTVGISSGFEASGITHIYYSVSGAMVMYVVDSCNSGVQARLDGLLVHLVAETGFVTHWV
jgi:hypothetical protein